MLYPKPGKRKKQGRYKGGIEKKAWNEFAYYVKISRLDSNNLLTCCTCGKRMRWEGSNQNVHAGHCYSFSKYPQMAYEITNVWPQCSFCNNPMNDVTGKFFMFMYRNLTENEIKKLEWLSMPKNYKKLSKEFLQVTYNEYKKKNQELRDTLGW